MKAKIGETARLRSVEEKEKKRKELKRRKIKVKGTRKEY